jgi:GrpB-like predicted nucleotidyltransferase (UPF0157 family)
MQVLVHPYNDDWPLQFEAIRQKIWPAVSHLASAIEHVGSTSVPGLAAKPVIDLDIIIPDREVLPAVTEALATLGYQHHGNQGIPDRDVFKLDEPVRTHHLYVCLDGSLALLNHLTLRDHLRAQSDDRDAFTTLKFNLAEEFHDDITIYTASKTKFILNILARNSFSAASLESIRRANIAAG